MPFCPKSGFSDMGIVACSTSPELRSDPLFLLRRTANSTAAITRTPPQIAAAIIPAEEEDAEDAEDADEGGGGGGEGGAVVGEEVGAADGGDDGEAVGEEEGEAVDDVVQRFSFLSSGERLLFRVM